MEAAGATIALAASIASLIHLSVKVVSRLHDFSSVIANVPESLRSLPTRLSLLTVTLQHIQFQVETGRLPYDTVNALRAVIDDTFEQLSIIQDSLSKVLLPDSFSKLDWVLKVLKSLVKEEKVQQAREEISKNLDILVLYQSTLYDPIPRTLLNLSVTPATLPSPSSNIPFRRNPDFVDQGALIDQLLDKSILPASRTALVGLGGIGKSQLAIELGYRIRERSPDTWVLWVHAGSTARLEQSFRDIADHVGIPGRQDAKANVFQLVYNWLHGGRSGRWLLILDNVDSPDVLAEARDAVQGEQRTGMNRERWQPVTAYLPQSQNGSILVTSRNQAVARKLVEEKDVMAIKPMALAQALALFEKKLGPPGQGDSTAELAAALDSIPLAIVQAAAYISQRMPQYSVRQYLADFRESDQKKTSLLNREGGLLRRDWHVHNPILITWQISFEHVQRSRPSAANLLSLMSFFERQSIPEALIRKYDNREEDEGDSDDASGKIEGDRFEDDVQTLRNYSFVFNDTDETFRMHALVKLATRKWLEGNGQLETWKQHYMKILLLNIRGRHQEAERIRRQTLVYRKGLEAATNGSETTPESDAASDNVSLPSIFSDAFGASASSQSSVEELLSVIKEFAALLMSNEMLGPLCKQAVESDSIGPERFGRNLYRLLKIYSKDLKHDAQNRLQDSAARLISSRAVYISHLIRAHYDHDYRTTSKNMKNLNDQTPDHARKERLEQYLDQSGGEGARMQAAELEAVDHQTLQHVSAAIPAQDIRGDAESSHSEDDRDYVDLPPLTQVEAFLVSGGAFRNLLKNFQTFVQPISNASTNVSKDEENNTENRRKSTLKLYFRRFFAALLELHLNVANRLTGFWEPPLGRGLIRVRWTCKCGRKIWDDFRELRQGAAEDLRKSLDYHERISTILPQSQVSDAEGTHSPLGQSPISLPTQNSAYPHVTSDMHLMHPTRTSIERKTAADVAADPHDQIIPETKKFLLLCFQKPSDTLRLFQLNLQHVTDDFELFRMLRETYISHRGVLARMFSLRKVVSVNFKKFERHTRDRVVILSSSDILPQRINPSACHEDHSLPKCDTEYDIYPSPPDLDPYIGRNGLAHLLEYPHESVESGNNLPSQKVWLKRFPKKQKTKLAICPPYQYGLGWGIEFEEGWYLSWVGKGFLVALMVAATTFLICWWKFRNDIQGATGMAALLLSYGALLLALIAAIALLPN